MLNFYEKNFISQDNKVVQDDNPTLFRLIERFISGEIKHRGKDKSKNTLKQYKSTYHHLLAFSKTKDKKGNQNKVDFDTITIDFYYRFVEYLKSDKRLPDKTGKLVKCQLPLI